MCPIDCNIAAGVNLKFHIGCCIVVALRGAVGVVWRGWREPAISYVCRCVFEISTSDKPWRVCEPDLAANPLGELGAEDEPAWMGWVCYYFWLLGYL